MPIVSPQPALIRPRSPSPGPADPMLARPASPLTGVKRTRDDDAVDAPAKRPALIDVPASPKALAQQAVAAFKAICADPEALAAKLAAEQKTGELLDPEAEKLFAGLPTLSARTTPAELVELGLIPQIPTALEAMWEDTPRYFVGRQVLVQVPVETDFRSPQFHTYKEDGELRVTHRAYLVGEAGPNFLVQVEGKADPITVPKKEIFALNEGQHLEGTRTEAWGVDFDYANDAIFKARLCAAIIALGPLLAKLDFSPADPAKAAEALAAVPQPPAGTLAFAGAGKMVNVPGYSQDQLGVLTAGVAAPLRDLLVALGGSPNSVGPCVQRVFNTLIGEDQAAKDLGTLDWAAFAAELNAAVTKDRTIAVQRQALTVMHDGISMQHPTSAARTNGFGTNYRPPAGGNGEAGKLANGGLGVCNLQASVLFGMLQPVLRLLGLEAQLEMGCCIRPRPPQQNPPHGWVMATFWPSGERYLSDRTWHHPCLALDYAFSPNGDRRHRAWDPHVVQNSVIRGKDVRMVGTFQGARPMPVGDAVAHGRPDH